MGCEFTPIDFFKGDKKPREPVWSIPWRGNTELVGPCVTDYISLRGELSVF
jgi:hypothetical protein